MPSIISVSRRTDVPAFHGAWFMDCLNRGYAECPNPFSKKMQRVSLRRDDVIGFVFWSKNFIPFLPVLDNVRSRGFQFYCLFTITGHDAPIEPHLPPLSDRIACFKTIASTHGADHVMWRFDPIIACAHSPFDMFRKFADDLVGSTDECITSFVQFYPKVRRRCRQLGMQLADPPIEEKRTVIERMADYAASRGMKLNVCCQDDLICGKAGKAHCVDIERFGLTIAAVPRKGTRKQCGCSYSRDIGTYNTCDHQCVYCYANA